MDEAGLEKVLNTIIDSNYNHLVRLVKVAREEGVDLGVTDSDLQASKDKAARLRRQVKEALDKPPLKAPQPVPPS